MSIRPRGLARAIAVGVSRVCHESCLCLIKIGRQPGCEWNAVRFLLNGMEDRSKLTRLAGKTVYTVIFTHCYYEQVVANVVLGTRRR